MIERAERRAIHAALERIRSGRLDLREEWSGERLSFGPGMQGSAPRSRCVRPTSTGSSRGSAASASVRPTPRASGTPTTWSPCFGSVPASFAAAIAFAAAWPRWFAPCNGSATLPVLNTRRGARRNIAAHYDLGNEMFELFLDREWMMYSSALFERADATLEEAQRAKLERICQVLELGPDRHLLGDRDRLGRAGALRGLALRLPRDHDHHLARAARVRRGTDSCRRPPGAGPGPRRRLPGAHRQLRQAGVDRDDRGGRVGVLRHVLRALLGAACAPRPDVPAGNRDRRPRLRGRKERPELLEHADLPRRLACPRSARSSARSRAGRTCAPSCSRTSAPSYVLTLRHWRQRFLAASEQLAELGYDERFRRLWEMYFAIAEAGFHEARLRDLQLVYAKPAWPGAASDAAPMPRLRGHERVR